MTYTYYYGVVCLGCKRFIPISEYKTEVYAAIAHVSLENGYPINCSECGFRHPYLEADLDYSQEQHEMVPLDRQRG